MSSFAKKPSNAPLSYIFGCRALIETIRAGRTIEKVFFQKNIRTARSKPLYDLICKHEIPFSYVPIEKLDRIARGNHQGVVAVLSPIVFTPLDIVVQTTFEKGKAPLIVVLDGVTDVHNIGAIARTALCMGVDALVLPTQGSAGLAGAAMKTSAGALATLPICRVADLSKALRYLQASGLTLLACHAEAAQWLYNIDLKLPIALILGGEGVGIALQHLRLANTILPFLCKALLLLLMSLWQRVSCSMKYFGNAFHNRPLSKNKQNLSYILIKIISKICFYLFFL